MNHWKASIYPGIRSELDETETGQEKTGGTKTRYPARETKSVSY